MTQGSMGHPTPVGDLKRWSCYVEAIDDDVVTLMMADEATPGDDEREIGEFPKHLLAHLDPKLGQYVTVRITAEGEIDIRNTEFTEEQIAKGRAEIDELLRLLAKLREDHDGPADHHDDTGAKRP